jgi:radial spoke head protein 4A
MDGGEEQELPPDVEPRGTGVNKLNYWACNSLLAEWVELPIITPQQVIISRKIKYLFSGDL